MKNLLEAFGLIEQYRKLDKVHFSGVKNNTLIEKAEKTLGIGFPVTYKEFLKKYGCGGVRGLEVYGVIDDDFEKPGGPDAIWLTLDERKNWKLPEELIIIGSTGDGFWYALDSSQPNAIGEYPVVIYGILGDSHYKEKIHEDFGEFLLEEIRFYLDSREEE